MEKGCLLLTPEVWVEDEKLFCVEKFSQKCLKQGSPQGFAVRQREYFKLALRMTIDTEFEEAVVLGLACRRKGRIRRAFQLI